MARIAIIGSNDLGLLIAHHATTANWEVAGFFDNRKEVNTPIDIYGKILGSVEDVEGLFNKKVFDYLFVGVGYTQFSYRKEVFERFKGRIPFANLIHKSAYVDSSVILGEGNFVLPGCVLDAGVCLDDNVLLNTGCTIAHHTRIKSHSFLAPGVTIAGKVVVDECCFLGVGCVIQDNVHISPRVLIGGGAVVVSNISEAGTYMGVPAKRTKDNIFFNISS